MTKNACLDYCKNLGWNISPIEFDVVFSECIAKWCEDENCNWKEIINKYRKASSERNEAFVKYVRDKKEANESYYQRMQIAMFGKEKVSEFLKKNGWKDWTVLYE